MRKYQLYLLVPLFVLFFNQVNAQFRLDNWKSHTSLFDVNSACIDNDGVIWGGSPGGIFKYNPADEESEIFTNVGSLLSNQISTISFNPAKNEIYAGTYDGYLEIYSEGKWYHILDIKNQNFTNSEIRSIAFLGNKAFIAGGFGLTVFDTERRVFLETILKFGNFQSNTPVNKILINGDDIWLATDAGLAKAKLTSLLPDPASWTNFTVKEGLYVNLIKDIAVSNGELFVMSDKFLLKYDGLKFEEFSKGDFFSNIVSTDGSNLFFSDYFKIFPRNQIPLDIQHPYLILGMTAASDKSGNVTIIIMYQENAIGIYQNNQLKLFQPNTPKSNNVKDMTVDYNGNLWIATDLGASGRGFAKFDGTNWTNFTSKSHPEIKDNSYHRIAVDETGRVAVANYGSGLLMMTPKENNEYNYKFYNETNSELRGLSVNPNYIAIGDIRFDRNSNIWIPNLADVSNGPSLVGITTDEKSIGITNPRVANQRYFMTLGIDYSGTKWVGGSNPSGTCLMYFNDMGTFENTNDDKKGYITSSNNPNLPDNIHNSIEIDKSGYVWIGTPRGVAVILNPSSVLSSNPNNIIIRSLSKLLGEVNVNDIMVDALNNKWIATSNGVWIINSDGSDTLGYIHSGNSPLPTNEILALTTNPLNGKIYFSSKFGIYEATSLSVQPFTDYNITCYPQPFDPKKDIEMVIDGLAEFSEVRILTTSGELINSINTNSRKTIWNGKDKEGNYVRSGIYLIVASSGISKVSSVQKIAIIEK